MQRAKHNRVHYQRSFLNYSSSHSKASGDVPELRNSFCMRGLRFSSEVKIDFVNLRPYAIH